MWSLGVVIILLLLTIECMEVGLNTMNKASTSRGMSNFVFIFYSIALAFFFLIPSTFIYHRIKPCTKLNFSIFCRLFLLALLSYSVQIFLYFGIEYSNPTLASAIRDLVPAFTFLIAVVTGMEKWGLKMKSSLAKSIGTIILIIGALVMTFYRGPPILSNQSTLVPKYFYQRHITTKSNWILGGFLLGVANFLLSLLYIVKTWIIKDFPEEFMVTTIMCGLVTIMAAMIGLIAEQTLSSWKLKPDLELITICYGAIMVALRLLVGVWSLKKKGPVFVVMVKPLGMVAAMIMGISFLGDVLHVGNIIGGTIIALGFYSVMWGKAKEEMCVDQDKSMESGSSTTRVTLLQKHSKNS